MANYVLKAILMQIYDHAARLRSYEITAEIFSATR